MTSRRLPRRFRFSIAVCALALLAVSPSVRAAHPNIIYILCDDLGYGDVKCLNADGKIATPNMDRLGKAGMIFTDAHSGSAVCSPTRYGIMTGRYSWRSPLQSGVLGGLSPRLIEPGRMTVASLLKDHGYATGCIGKWHLGMDWTKLPGARTLTELSCREQRAGTQCGLRAADQERPEQRGFRFLLRHQRLARHGAVHVHRERPRDGIADGGQIVSAHGRTEEQPFDAFGPGAPEFEAHDVLPTLDAQYGRVSSASAQRQAKAGKPFFLYLPLNAPHTPIAPSPEWQGKSGINPYGDYVMETDWAVGEVLKALDQQGLAENTLVIMTSDNGCSPQANFADLAAHGHNPSYVFRGTKADIWDGGHHIPFLVRWPARIKAGSTSDQVTCLTDFMATCAEIVGARLPDDAGEDSVSLLPALLGQADKPLHEAVVHHSINGSFAIREGNWKLELCSGSGGWTAPRPGTAEAQKLPKVQLYDMTADIGEKTNVQADHTEVVDRLTRLLEKFVADGRSTPGVPQKNDVPIELWKDKTYKAKSGAAD